ncbi:MAG TPA: glycosyltransferase family 4 protein [Pseudonocardiaceae bacterium]|jgi:glycosyltransferase involved in cell wall biosynthesis
MTGRRALWVSTGLTTRGGVSSCVRTFQGTPLWEMWSIRHVATHRDGSAVTRILAFLRGLGAYLYAVTVHRPDVVHLHMASYGSFIRKATLARIARLLRLPVVLHIHGSEFALFHERAPRLLQRIIVATLTDARAVVALGDRWARRLREIAPAASITVIPNAIPIGEPVSQPGEHEDVHVVFLGAIGDRKGAFTLLDAWGQVVGPGGAAARLTIAGDGEISRARTAIGRLGLGDSVEIRTWMTPAQTRELLRSAHVLVLPSRDEGQPMAVLEAMANGLCVVASTAGGIPDLIVDGTSGVLIPHSDVDALADALRRVLTDHETRARLGTGALERARQNFDVDVVWKRFDLLYREVLG